MYEIEVQAEFAAAHSLVIGGEREPVHGHNWRVSVVVAGPALNSDGLLCDFHAVERRLLAVVGEYHNRNLNDVAPFNHPELNPSAENVAKHIATELQRRLVGVIPQRAHLVSVRVTEAPGCAATYRPPAVGVPAQPAGARALPA